MRDINDVLKLFANNTNMDYCKDFDSIKAIFEYCDENVKEFARVQYRGGNDEIIHELVTRVQLHFSHMGYMDRHNRVVEKYDHHVRKIAFFLILNTDMSYKYNLMDEDRIAHVLEVTPPLTKCILISLIWELKLDKYFYEMLSYTPCWFSFQFYDPAIASIKFLEPYDVLKKVDNLIKSIFMSISRSDYHNLEVIDKKRIFQIFHDNSMELLRQFYTPDIEKFTDWSKKRFFKYAGFSILHLIDMILYCFDRYECREKFKIEDKYSIYDIFKKYAVKSGSKTGTYSDLVKDIQMKIIMALLNSLQYNVMLVTVDVFMHWAEEDLSADLTLQAAIGEKAYYLVERMKENKSFGHDVYNQLAFILRRPQTLQEKIKNSTMGHILQTIDDFTGDINEKRMWFDELFERPVAFANDECLETIRSQAKLLTVEHCMKILDYLKLYLESGNNIKSLKEEHEGIVSIMMKSLQNFSTDDLIQLVLYSNKQFGNKSDLFEQADLEERCVALYNKWSGELDLQEFLILCFENTYLVLEKFLLDISDSEGQIENYFKALCKIHKITKIYVKPLFAKSIRKLCSEKYFPNYLYGFYQTEMLTKEEFFKDFIYCHVVNYMHTKSYDNILNMLKGLLLIANKSAHVLNFGELTSPVLVMSGHVMDECRWDLVTYTDVKEEIVKTCIEFIQIVSKKFLPVANEADKRWISNKTRKYRPLTMYYFQKYSLSITEQPKPFDKFLHPEEFENITEIEKFLTSTYVRCTRKETEWLAKSEKLLPHFSNVMIIIEGIVNDLGNLDGISNFRHCLVNYANIIKKFLIPKIENNNSQISDLGYKILNIISGSPQAIYDEVFMLFQGILLEVYQQSSSMEEELIKEVRKFVSTMKDCKGKELFHEKFQAIAIENLS